MLGVCLQLDVKFKLFKGTLTLTTLIDSKNIGGINILALSWPVELDF